jgi:hypothetical protein
MLVRMDRLEVSGKDRAIHELRKLDIAYKDAFLSDASRPDGF